MTKIKKELAYKVFDPNWCCREFQYKVGKTYADNRELTICKTGFHACKKLSNCFNYYSFNPKNKVAEVELCGEIKTEGDKCCTNKIKILRELSWSEVLNMVNLGDSNSGYRNLGDSNSGNSNLGNSNLGDSNLGYRNSGNRNLGNSNLGNSNLGNSNLGYRNSGNSNLGNRNLGDRNLGDGNLGDRNLGNWNLGDSNLGDFNTTTPSTIKVFNVECERKLWGNCNKPNFLFFEIAIFIGAEDLTEEEKIKYPNGYIKKLDYKTAFQKSYNSLAEEEKIQQTEILKKLPNFDADIFFQISGIQIK